MCIEQHSKKMRGVVPKIRQGLFAGLTLFLLGTAAYAVPAHAQTSVGTVGPSQKKVVENPRTASSDRNLAESMLYQWWGPFEAPDGKAFLPYLDFIFGPDAYLNMGKIELKGREEIKASFSARPLQGGVSHHMSNVEVKALGHGLFQIDSDFVYQVKTPDGNVQAGNSSYRHTVQKLADGTFRFKSLTAQLGEPISGVTYEDTYALHRAQGAIVQYLGVSDLLESDYIRLTQVLAEDATITGMFDPAKQTFNARGDGSLIGHDEIANWLASRKNSFAWVAHKLKSIEVMPTGDNRFEAKTVVDVEAQPLGADKISVTLPIKMILEENGGRFMKITRIMR